MRIVCFGHDGRVGSPDVEGNAVVWAREMARLVDEYVVIAPAPDGRFRGPIRLEGNAAAYLLPGNPLAFPFRAARLAERLHARTAFDLCSVDDPVRVGLAGVLFTDRCGVPMAVRNSRLSFGEPASPNPRPLDVSERIAASCARRAKAVLNFSPDQNAALLGAGVEANRIYVVPPPAFALPSVAENSLSIALALASDDPVVLAAGPMMATANLGALIKGFARVFRRRPARLLISGDGPERAAWQRQAEHAGLGGAVRWLDPASRIPMAALLHACDVFATSALWAAGPRSVLHAYQHNRPVLATPHMGVVHAGVCVHGETAQIAEPNDAAAIADGLDALLADPRWARRLAREGHARTAETCSVRVVARKTAAVYRETIRRARFEALFASEPLFA